MTAPADDPGAPAPLAYLLAPVAGFVDAVGFITLAGIFVANMSGNTVRFAVDVGQGEWGDALTRGVPVLFFVVGVALAIGVVSAIGRRVTPSTLMPLLTVEVVLVAAFMLVGTLVFEGRLATGNSAQFYVLILFAVVAMAIQTVTLRRVAGVPVQTAYVTSMLAFVGEEAVEAVAERGTPRGAEARRRIRIHGGVWLTYLAGGGVGALLADKVEYMALIVPLVVLAIVLVLARKPALPDAGAA
ncbi:MAG: YoaK family protein [Acidimicrobiia bacterium]